MKRLFALVGTLTAVVVLAASPAHAAVAWSLGTVDAVDQDSPPSSITVFPDGHPVGGLGVGGATILVGGMGRRLVEQDPGRRRRLVGRLLPERCRADGQIRPGRGAPGIAWSCHAQRGRWPAGDRGPVGRGRLAIRTATRKRPAPSDCSSRDLTNVGLAFDATTGDPQLGYGSDAGEVRLAPPDRGDVGRRARRRRPAGLQRQRSRGLDRRQPSLRGAGHGVGHRILR